MRSTHRNSFLLPLSRQKAHALRLSAGSNIIRDEDTRPSEYRYSGWPESLLWNSTIFVSHTRLSRGAESTRSATISFGARATAQQLHLLAPSRAFRFENIGQGSREGKFLCCYARNASFLFFFFLLSFFHDEKSLSIVSTVSLRRQEFLELYNLFWILYTRVSKNSSKLYKL